jgi:hypothetical protein
MNFLSVLESLSSILEAAASSLALNEIHREAA